MIPTATLGVIRPAVSGVIPAAALGLAPAAVLVFALAAVPAVIPAAFRRFSLVFSSVFAEKEVDTPERV